MHAVVWEALGTVALEELPEPELLASTDVIVRITATTICGSDLHIIAGHMGAESGFPIGHECVGVVASAGAAVTNFTVGQRVMVPPVPWCGTCETCRRGQIQRCERAGIFGSGPAVGDLGGAQATSLRVPWADHCLQAVPDAVSDRDALAVSDVLVTGYTGVRHANVEPGGTVVVFGCGPVGLSAVHTASRLTGAGHVVAVDPIALRRERALELGADVALAPDEDVAGVVNRFTGGWGADSVIDAAGVQATFDTAGNIVAIGGSIALIGIPSRPHQMNVFDLLMKSVHLWTGQGELQLAEPLMRHVAAGIVDPGPLFTHEASLEELPDYYRRLAGGDLDIIKILTTTASKS